MRLVDAIRHYETLVRQRALPLMHEAKRLFVAWLRTFRKHDEAVEFLPAALEVLETPPSPLGRAIMVALCSFFAIALAWSCIGSVDIIATARGKIVPTGHTKIVQPLEQGVVRAIHVQDGQSVKEGDVLIEIDTTISEAERDRLQSDLIAEQIIAARLKAALAIRDDPASDFVAPEQASPQQTDLQRSQLINQVTEIRAKLTALDRQIAQNEGNSAAVSATIDKLTKSIPMLRERAAVRKQLFEKGYGSKLDMLATQQDLVEHEQDLRVQQGRLTEATAGVESLRNQRAQAEAEYRHKVLADLTDAEQKASSLQEQVVQATQKYQLQTLTAPVDGTVQQLAIHTEGGVVTPAQALLAVVPADSHLEIEAMISNRDIGFVHANQDAAIKVDTFNFTRYGLIHGHVLSVSQDSIVHEKPQGKNTAHDDAVSADESSEPQGQELVYAARVALDRTQMDVDGRLVNLTPGMAVTVEIKTGERRLISYLLSPLVKYQHQAFRER